ncbi:hypothetical protein ABZ454_05315 [Streptomyces sp. NPDC005803]|uniref:AMP-binding enzyme n=1 Tax=Streptomyces sp. NPDC005803 TaxID=3154297 RepID=UPI00340198AB
MEEVVQTHPAVAATVVLGIPDDRPGETVAVRVRLRPGAEPDPEAWYAYAADRLASFKVPRTGRFLSEFPMRLRTRSLTGGRCQFVAVCSRHSTARW